MLAITRRPSATTPGSAANWPSSSTSWATARVAGAPLPIATPMSASLSASASFTPSPVIATTCARCCSARDHRPLLVRGDPAEHRWSARRTSASSSGPRAARGRRRARSAPGRPTRRATAADGARVVARDDLERDALVVEVRAACRPRRAGPAPRTSRAPPAPRPCGSVLAVERRVGVGQEQHPLPGARPARRPGAARGSGRQPASTISGAPSTQRAAAVEASRRSTCAPRRTAPTPSASNPSDGGKAAASAPSVALGFASSASAPSAGVDRSPSCPSSGSSASNAMSPSVRVPVLSRQTTSTRARPSTAGSSCTSTLRRARRDARRRRRRGWSAAPGPRGPCRPRRRPCRRWRPTRSRCRASAGCTSRTGRSMISAQVM